MKILYVVSNADLHPNANTGYGRHIREIVDHLHKLGADVEVYAAKTNNIVALNDHQKSSSKSELPKPSKWKAFIPSILWETLRDVRYFIREKDRIKSIERIYKEGGFNLIFERSAYLSFAAASVAHKLKVPYFLEVNSPFVEQRERLSGKSFLMNYAHKIEVFKGKVLSDGYCVSQVLVDYYVREYGYSASKMRSIPNAVDVGHFHSSEEDNKRDAITIGFVGSILPYHGVDMLLEAFHLASKELQNLRLKVVGDGKDLKVYQRQVQDWGIQDDVTFTGSIPHRQVESEIASMDICVNPKHSWYGSPIKIFEYGAMRKAIIAANEKPIAEVLTNGEDGLLIDSSVDALKEAILTLAKDVDLRKRVAQSFHQKVLANYTWEKNAAKIYELLGDL